MKNIAIFASGNGSNAENIIKYFEKQPAGKVTAIYSNKPTAYVLERAKHCNVPSSTFTREELHDGSVLEQLRRQQVDYIVLAGFLWLLPTKLISAYEGKIVNIHPSLLPKYGGKGMYGSRVHEAVISGGEAQSGITIHLVNEEYDKGTILAQAEVPVHVDDTPASLAAKIHELEYRHYPVVIEEFIKNS